MNQQRAELIDSIDRDRNLAHNILFKHRHPDKTPDFHQEIIPLWHSQEQRLIIEAFRGAAKSTIAEEGTIIQALLGEIKNGVIVGSSFNRAVERLVAIAHEIQNNPIILDIFGDMSDDKIWSEHRIVLSNGTMLQAVGRGQSLRGIKYLEQRPDYFLCDDFEDEESSATKESNDKVLRWVMKVLIPALDIKKYRGRIVGTPLDPRAALVKLSQDPKWLAKKYPIEYLDAEGQRTATWPERFPLNEIDNIRDSYMRLGLMRDYSQEYMCKAEDERQKPFKPNMFKIEPQVRTWQGTFAFYDPAKTIGARSAQTGVAVWSWVQNRLIVWDAYGKFYKPDEIIEDIFRVNREYQPVAIGVEQDGLEEFIMQPLRQEMLRRKISLPIRPMRAPRGKIDFIKGLQPFFNAHEVIFHQNFPDLEDQLLAFPSGLVDVPNALAYALKMRPGLVVYEDFTMSNVREEVILYPGPVMLCINATGGYTTCIAVQYSGGAARIVADWVRDGDAIKEIIHEAALEFKQIKLCAPAWHWDKYKNVGLLMHCREAGYQVSTGSAPLKGQSVIKDLLKGISHGQSTMQIAVRARWTLNGFCAGYAREIDKDSRVSDIPVDNVYKTLIESLECYLGGMYDGNVATERNYNYDSKGRPYLSALRSNK